jgi:nitrogenase molybdenum-iron protein alpha chain
VTLPYTDWWLSQKDPFILAKRPELLDSAPSKFDKPAPEKKTSATKRPAQTKKKGVK